MFISTPLGYNANIFLMSPASDKTTGSASTNRSASVPIVGGNGTDKTNAKDDKPTEFIEYKIQPGDTYSQIADKYPGVLAAELEAINRTPARSLQVGQTIQIPVKQQQKPQTQNKPETSVPAPQSNLDAEDELVAIADEADSEYDSDLNGQYSVCPRETAATETQAAQSNGNQNGTESAAPEQPKEYIVQEKDTVESICKAHNITSTQLTEANKGVDFTKLIPGKTKLVIPEPMRPFEITNKELGSLEKAAELTSRAEGFAGEAYVDVVGYAIGYGQHGYIIDEKKLGPALRAELNGKDNAQKRTELEKKLDKKWKDITNNELIAQLSPDELYKYYTDPKKTYLKEVKSDTTCTELEANVTLKASLLTCYKQLYDFLGEEAYNNLNEDQLAALASYVYNGGIGNSPALIKALKEGRYDDAQAELDRFSANGEILPGLFKRRAKEMVMFGSGKLSEQAQKKLLDKFNTLYKCNPKYESLAALLDDIDNFEEKLPNDRAKANVHEFCAIIRPAFENRDDGRRLATYP